MPQWVNKLARLDDCVTVTSMCIVQLVMVKSSSNMSRCVELQDTLIWDLSFGKLIRESLP